MSAPDDRTHRVVARLRADEVAFLEKNSRGCNMPLYSMREKRACPHLRLFHNKGTTIYGGPWWACRICAVGDEEDREEQEERYQRRTERDRVERRNEKIVLFLGGVLLGAFGVVLPLLHVGVI